MLSPAELVALGNFAMGALALIISIWARFSSRNRSDIEELRHGEIGLDNRLTKVEAEVEHAPNLDSVHALALALSEMKGQLGMIGVKLEPMARVTERLQDWLLENGK